MKTMREMMNIVEGDDTTKVEIALDDRSGMWIVFRVDDTRTDILAEFDLFSMARNWCESNDFDWSLSPEQEGT